MIENIIFKIIFYTKCTRWVLNRCSNVICFFSWSLNQNHFPHKIHFPHKMHKRRIDLFVCFVSSSLIQNHIIFHTKCTGGGGLDQPAGVSYTKTIAKGLVVVCKVEPLLGMWQGEVHQDPQWHLVHTVSARSSWPPWLHTLPRITNSFPVLW